MANMASSRRVRRVLVVDDDREGRYALCDALRNAGFEAVEADNGERGLAVALRIYPDAIISGQVMPKMGGTQFLIEIRKDPLLSKTPFILLLSDYDELGSTFDNGADDVLGKPVVVADLLARLRRLVQPAPPPETRSGIKGKLEFFALSDVLVMTSQNRQTGVLEVTDEPTAQKTKFIFENGSVAAVNGPQNVEGDKAFFRAMRIVDGTFKFTPWRHFERKPWHMRGNINNLLLAATQEVDELPLLLRELEGDSAQYALAPGVTNLDDQEVVRPLLAGTLRTATVQQLLDASTQLDLNAAKQLVDLVKSGRLIRRRG